MAFCNSCGASLSPGTKFCNKCGAAVTGAPIAAAPAPVPTGGSSAIKVILIVVAVIVGIGILGIATVGFVGYRFAKHAHMTQDGDHVKVETPFVNIETSKDPEQATRDLGVDIYPGAQVQKDGATSATFGNMRTVAANFESNDSVDKVCSFYRSKFPNSMVTTTDQNHCTIVSNDHQNMVTINVEGSGGTTKFQVTNVSKKPASTNN